MSKWMVDIVGKDMSTNDKVEKVVEQGIDKPILEKFIYERSQLTKNVVDYINLLGYDYSDIGGSPESWHIGVPFDNLYKATDYLSKISSYFSKAISLGLLKFKLMSWSKKSWEVSK